MTRILSALFLALLLLPLGACDSDEGPKGSEVDGRYRATAFTFTQEGGTLIGTVDVLSYMATVDGERVLTLDLFGQDLDYTLAFQLASENSRSSIRGAFTSQSNNRVRLDLGDDPDGPRILLPAPLTLTSSSDRSTLTASSVTTATFEQLAALDPDEYGGLSGGNVRGRVEIRLVRE